MSLSSDDKLIKLKSNDGLPFSIKMKAAKKSNVIARLIEDLNLETKTGDDEIPLPKVSSVELKKIIDFLEAHQDDTASLAEYRAALDKDQISDFDKTIITAERNLLVDIFNGSDYLDIEILKELIAFAIAKSIKGKSPAEINEIWQMSCDFEPNELRQIKEEMAWVEAKKE